MNDIDVGTRPPGSAPALAAGCRTRRGACFLFRRLALAGACLLTGLPAHSGSPPSPDRHADTAAFLSEAQRIVAEASTPAARWSGPESGPPGAKGKRIALVAEDLRNGGVLGVAQGVREAASVLGWDLKIFDARGTPEGRTKALAAALESAPDGMILSGSDALENNAGLKAFSARRIPVVGWHVGTAPGPIPGTPVAMNVTTDPLAVARVTAMAAVAQAKGHAGVVILTDSRFGIAMAKARAMADVIRRCEGCTLLEMRDLAISESSEKMPAATQDLLARYGRRWTHALAINDIYFDHAVSALTKAGMPSNGISLLSAGDGSAPAFLRIQAGAYQTGTVAEPLNLQGWQLIDELNRLFAGQPVSGFVAPVHLVSAHNIAHDGGPKFQYDPENGYRDAYRRIWKR